MAIRSLRLRSDDHPKCIRGESILIEKIDARAWLLLGKGIYDARAVQADRLR